MLLARSYLCPWPGVFHQKEGTPLNTPGLSAPDFFLRGNGKSQYDGLVGKERHAFLFSPLPLPSLPPLQRIPISSAPYTVNLLEVAPAPGAKGTRTCSWEAITSNVPKSGTISHFS